MSPARSSPRPIAAGDLGGAERALERVGRDQDRALLVPAIGAS